MSEFQCDLEIPDVKGLEPQKLTVGRLFYFHCRGDWPPGLQVDRLSLRPIAESMTPYDLRLLNFEFRDPKTADLLLVSYRPGPHAFSELILSDGILQVKLPTLSFNTHSVLPEGQTVEPYGPLGPMTLTVPWPYWMIVISLLGIFVFSSLLLWKKKQARRRLLQYIQSQATHPSPLVQFHRDLRILTKKAGLADLDHQLKADPARYLRDLRSLCEIFWGRKFHVALLEKSPGALRPEFRSQAPKTYIRYEKELLFWNQKWEQLFKSSRRAKFEDFQDFTKTTRELIEKMAEDSI